MLQLVKLILNIFFGVGPIKTRTFEKFVSADPNDPLDVPESLNNILKTEYGNIVYYDKLITFESENTVYRLIEDKPRYLNGGMFVEPSRHLFSIGDGCIVGENGIIYESTTRCAITESHRDWKSKLSQNKIFSSFRLKKPVRYNGIALSLCTTSADGGFYHFFFEALPKLFFCKDILPRVNYIVVPGVSTAWKRRWLDHCDISPEKILWQTYLSHYQFDQLLFTSRLISDQQISPWVINALRNLCKYEPSMDDTRLNIVYISRKNVSERVIKWEKRFLELNPFIRAVDSATMEVVEVIEVFKSAKVVLSAHGAGLCNIIFCSENTRIIELYPLGKEYQPYYQRLSNQLNLTHTAIWVDFEDPLAKFGMTYLADSLEALIEEIRTYKNNTK